MGYFPAYPQKYQPIYVKTTMGKLCHKGDLCLTFLVCMSRSAIGRKHFKFTGCQKRRVEIIIILEDARFLRAL